MQKFYVAILLAAIFPGAAMAATKVDKSDIDLDTYISAEVGAAFYQKFNQEDYGGTKPKPSLLIGVGVGKYLHKALAIETNMHRFNNIKLDKFKNGGQYNQKLSGTNLGVNFKLVAYDFTPYFKPYINVGAGVAWVDSNPLHLSKTPNTGTIDGRVRCNLSYNLGAGFITPITKSTAVKVGYQYFDLGRNGSSQSIIYNGVVTTPLGGEASTRIRAHTVVAGLQYSF